MFHERDLKLPKSREKLMKRIEKDLLEDENIIGVFYGGSIGSGNTDLYSDIDLRVVVTDEAYSHYVEMKLNRARCWGEVLFYEQAAQHLSYTVVHYRSFVKVDCFYYRLNDLKPSVWLNDISIVKDSTAKLTELRAASQTITYQPTVEEFNQWRGKLFAYFHEAYRRIMREEWLYAQNMFLGLKWLIASGWYMQKGIQPNSFGDWSKVEGARSPLDKTKRDMLYNWHFKEEQEELLQVINDMAVVARELDIDLSKQFNNEAQTHLFDDVIALIF
ncbi:aminoglycoside 6-adenylyltransferase [Pseudalkalibacillus berkeleyi]|uniref:Aminoglycoside 6-adenylyltransferase n=1 Tax=Pseudalkalibacillus berkeleyi TaxID=1069813 RepID=A0ABS9GY91_9BACL|nr:aminoglycoside 6-adenylyltransferase [Pseudalkalibacillus berkeleyi]MCF6136665.1 aminoglycoside 6-adenylyltransferase [Pseudalkalibacillus berkeleyi]